MDRLFRWTLRLFTFVVVMTASAAGLSYFFAARSLPDYDATFSLDGISAPVEIVRDNANVPHVFGVTDEDVFFDDIFSSVSWLHTSCTRNPGNLKPGEKKN